MAVNQSIDDTVTYSKVSGANAVCESKSENHCLKNAVMFSNKLYRHCCVGSDCFDNIACTVSF